MPSPGSVGDQGVRDIVVVGTQQGIDRKVGDSSSDDSHHRDLSLERLGMRPEGVR